MTRNLFQMRLPGYKSLHEGVKVLYLIWTRLDWKDPVVTSSKDGSLSLVFNRCRARCRRALERLIRVHPIEVLESIVDCWDRELSVCQFASNL